MEVRDSNGNILSEGDSVIIIKSLPVKGTPKGIKLCPIETLANVKNKKY